MFKNLNQDEFSRDKQQEVRCINGKDSIIINPIIEWRDCDVWTFLNDVVRVPHCELYDPPYNRRRIGCILCPMSSMRTKLRDIELYPHIKHRWLEVFEYFIGGGTTQAISGESKSNPRMVPMGGGEIQSVQEKPCRTNRSKPSSGPIRKPLRLYGERAAELPPPAEERTRNGKPRWGQAGVSLSAEVLFDWWLTHESWEEFKADLEHPKLFDDL